MHAMVLSGKVGKIKHDIIILSKPIICENKQQII